MDVIAKAKEYIKLKDEATRLNKKLSALRKELIPVLEKNEWYLDVGDGYMLELQERISYDYDPYYVQQYLKPLHLYEVVKEITINKKKFEGLIKGGFISEEIGKTCRRELKRTKAIIIKKEEKNANKK